ncbi:hypothetical protein PHAVU_009G056100 [Phaseolus vulgaris]|uniref:Uncharacterized protein n=1 Tax=Phaseolus vulgaris TaxID=3885 RepID=V7ASK3_PHAVU|nr:hypothetical protein PHAVU_009G056100g [Phaseolus vulgaris]ESW08564.1 hypothetical protein PHAVU_009G056100g [Phaseolus vulgaris]
MANILGFFFENSINNTKEAAEKGNKTRRVAVATTAAVVVEFYDAYGLEVCGGSNLGWSGREMLEWGRSGQEHMNWRVRKPRETQSILESYSYFLFFFFLNCLLLRPLIKKSVVDNIGVIINNRDKWYL